MRGRKPDNAAQQHLKGNPGRRKKAKKEPAAERAAKLASAPASGSDRLSPPAYMAGDKFEMERSIWNELVTELAKMNLLHRLDRYTLAMLCTHIADWVAATKDIKESGSHYAAENVNGKPLMRLNPAVKVREIAEKHILDIGDKFGMNPFQRYKLLRDQAAVGIGDLWSAAREREKEQAEGSAAATDMDDEDDPVGRFNGMSGTPERPN